LKTHTYDNNTNITAVCLIILHCVLCICTVV